MPELSSSAFPPGLVIYQIYPRSFKDSNGDGIGDLGGIISKLDYLSDLGITAIWLCPVYPSPLVDFGYDVSDYQNVDPLFGDLKQLDGLIAGAHQRGIKIILDLVLNHTSDQHSWFIQSRQSRYDPKRDWYVWRDGRGQDAPPNNWISNFGGSAWEFDQKTSQYYLHSFFNEQPDLNWNNPEVREAIKNVIRFWLDRNIDGFRLDAVYSYGKDPTFQDDPVNPDFNPKTEKPFDSLLHSHSEHQGSVFKYLSEIADVLSEYKNRFMVTEAYPHEPFNIGSYLEFYERVNPLVAAPFNFMSMYLPWNAPSFQHFVNNFQAALKPNYQPVYVYGNHDRPRLASRIGPQAVRAAALLQLSMPGVAVIYYGEELGLQNIDVPGSEIKDKYEKNVPNLGAGRDAERSPMQWSSDANAGFSTAKPWLNVATDYQTNNVASQLADPGSILNLYKKLLALRKTSAAIRLGSYQPLTLTNLELLGFVREYQNEKLAIVINFSSSTQVPLELKGQTIISTEVEPSLDALKPGEGRVIKL